MCYYLLNTTPAGDSATERDVFLYRAMIAQKQFSVLNAEIKGSSPPQLVAIKAYASYLSSGDADSNLKLLGALLASICSIIISRLSIASSGTRELG